MLVTSIFSFIAQCFRKLSCSGSLNQNCEVKKFTTQPRLLTTLIEKAFENTAEKGENAGNQHFLLFPQCFQHFLNQISMFNILSSVNAFNLNHSKLFSFSKELSYIFILEKLLITSNFFSHCVFYLFGELFAIFVKFEFVVCRVFEFGRV